MRPLEGESVAEFARRVSRDEASAARLLALATPPSRTRTILLPYAGLSDETRLAAVRALFPSDARATIGWLHVAVGTEPLASIASWFTGDERLAVRLAELNGLTGPFVTRGTLVKVPVEYLLAPFRDAEPIPDEEPPRLEYGADAKGKYAVYRLKRKEALYSAVVVRFTGRLHAGDVIQLALDIALRSGIDDVHGIPVGFPVKIPLELLSEEYLPPDDPKTAAREKERAEAALFATPAKARGLAGVRVVIDAGTRRARHRDAPPRRLGVDLRLRRRLAPAEGPPRDDARRGRHDDARAGNRLGESRIATGSRTARPESS